MTGNPQTAHPHQNRWKCPIKQFDFTSPKSQQNFDASSASLAAATFASFSFASLSLIAFSSVGTGYSESPGSRKFAMGKILPQTSKRPCLRALLLFFAFLCMCSTLHSPLGLELGLLRLHGLAAKKKTAARVLNGRTPPACPALVGLVARTKLY